MTEKYHLNFRKTWSPERSAGFDPGAGERISPANAVSRHGRMREDIDEYRASLPT